jgi:hypothetical protein
MLERPSVEATERSISPTMIINVIGRAIMARSMISLDKVAKLKLLKKYGESMLPMPRQMISTMTRSVSHENKKDKRCFMIFSS